MAQSTTVDCGASGSKSLKQSPQLEVQGADALQRQRSAAGRGRRRRGCGGRGCPRRQGLAAAGECGHQPTRPEAQSDDEQAAATPSRFRRPAGGVQPRPAARRGPAGCPGREALAVRRARCAPGCAQLPAAPGGAGRYGSRRGRRRRVVGRGGVGCRNGQGLDRRRPRGGGGTWSPASLCLGFSSVTENSPLPCVFAAAGGPASWPFSGSPLRNSIEDAGRRMPQGRGRGAGGATLSTGGGAGEQLAPKACNLGVRQIDQTFRGLTDRQR